MKKAEKIIIKNNCSLLQALEQLEQTHERLLICVDSLGVLTGVINDGDIRRAIINGANLTDKVSKWMQTKYSFVNNQCSFEEAAKLLTNRINALPVVDHNHQVVGFHTIKEKVEYTDIKIRNVTILGMGYVGLTLAVSLADVGFEVKGFDTNKELIKKLKEGKSHFYEKGLDQYLDRLRGKNLNFVSCLDEAKANVYVITVGTPIIKKEMKPDINDVCKAAAEVGKIMEHGDLIIFRSTLPIEFCRKYAIPILEEESGLKVGKDFYLSFAPERTTEGQALKELRTNPQIIGGYDERSIELCSRLFNSLTHSVINVESLEAAETCKLIDNSYRDHVFAFANQLAPLTESLGLDLYEIIDAVNHGYTRNSVPKPSPGVGGACLSKDPYILNMAFEERGLDSSLILSARKINQMGPVLLKEKIDRLLKKIGKNTSKAKIFLIGMAFKGTPETSDLRESTSLWFLDKLPEKQNIYAYDPVVNAEEIRGLGISYSSLEDGFQNADVVVFLNNHISYQNIDIFSLTRTMNLPGVFIDTWHIFQPMDIKRVEGILYGGIGND